MFNNRSSIRWLSKSQAALYRLTGGALGGNIGLAPILLLTTRGRISGEPRTTPLIFYQNGADVVVCASNAGDDAAPQWWLNLQADPIATVQIKREVSRKRARKANPEEHANLWPRMLEIYPAYAGYQTRTSREIALVVLSRLDSN
jgi:deazaflavin-dependent oxidoreductase (nitroreductase family)